MEYPQDFWNQRYSDAAYAYGTEPNQYFKTQLDCIANPGRILLLCEGEGRNAVYAAQKGWQVTAVDFSKIGQQKALKLAAEKHVSIEYMISDVAQFEFDKYGPWDIIGLFYAHFPSNIRASIHQKCSQALAPKGQILLEGFNQQQLGHASGGPKNMDMLYSQNMLAEDFAGLDILENSELTIMLKEGEGHVGLGYVVQFRGSKR